MNYKKHYDLLIERARTRKLTGYFERHHVIPKCLGGSNDKSNIVRLTPEEHYVAHQLLVKIYPDNESLVYAARKMTVSSKFTKRNNKSYGWIKKKYLHICKKRIGDKNPSYGRSWYHCPVTFENGKFLKDNVPNGWVKGRTPKIRSRYCRVCNEFVDNVLSKHFKEVYCLNHRYDYVEERRTNEWHTPAGVFNNPDDAAKQNNCTRKTIYNRTKNNKFDNYFLIAR
jgi:hypothetical protein